MSVPYERPDWTGRRLELTIESVAHGGHCVARYEGRVLFVRHALPGEQVIAEVTEDKGGSFCRADATEIIRPSTARTTPPCPFAAPGMCGGCDWQHATPQAQRELKSQVVAEQLRRLAGLDWPIDVEKLPGGPLGWRTRVRLAVNDQGRPGLRAYRSHTVIPVTDCLIATPGVLEGLRTRRWVPGAELEIVRDGAEQTHIYEVVDDRYQRQITGDGVARERAAGREWLLSARGFWQVHPAAADTLAQVVAEWAQAPDGGIAWDLYGGVGLFGSVLAQQVGPTGSVLVIESSRQAVRDGEVNLVDLPQVRFIAGRVERVLNSITECPDVVVLDPPRKGAGKQVVTVIAKRQPSRIVYVACDPAALARDLDLFATHGYQLTQLRAFDAFPMTHHVECVALLVR